MYALTNAVFVYVCVCLCVSVFREMLIMKIRVYSVKVYSMNSVSVCVSCAFVCVQGDKARKWEEQLEVTEKRLRDHLDMLVKSETIAGYTRDRARLTRYATSFYYTHPFRYAYLSSKSAMSQIRL